MNDTVKVSTNQFEQNSSVKLADDLNILSTENVIEFPVDLTTFFNIATEKKVT